MFKTIVVVDKEYPRVFDSESEVVDFQTYLREYPKLNEPRTRVVNLCDTSKYLSEGYYCSLLAEARHHHVLPSVKTINELRSGVTEYLDSRIASKPELVRCAEIAGECMFVFMGVVESAGFEAMGKKIFSRYPVPILKLQLSDYAVFFFTRLRTDFLTRRC